MRSILTACGWPASPGRHLWPWHSWLVAALAAAGLAVGTASPAWATCSDDTARHVVLLEATNQEDASRKAKRTGIIMSETGLVLTVYSLIGGEVQIRPSDLIGSFLADKVKITLPDYPLPGEPGEFVNLMVLGHDWRRDILLLKVTPFDQIDVERAAADLSRKSIAEVDEVCFVGFEGDAQDGYFAIPSDVREIRPTAGIDWISRQMRSDATQYGGAVFDAEDEALVGMITNSSGGNTEFLPIEYSDTLLSQIFISRIMKELDDVRDVTEQMKMGVSWGMRVLENTTEELEETKAEALAIRFFFTQHVDQHESKPIDLWKVKVKAVLTGEIRDDEGTLEVREVPLRTHEKSTIRITSGENFFDYDGTEAVEEAMDLGFQSLLRIKLTIVPVFKVGEEEFGQRNGAQRRAVFDIPLQPLVR